MNSQKQAEARNLAREERKARMAAKSESTAVKTGLKPSIRYPVQSRALPFKAKVEEKKIAKEPEVVEIAEPESDYEDWTEEEIAAR